METTNSPHMHVPLASLTSEELAEIKATEQKLGNKYYLIAYQQQ